MDNLTRFAHRPGAAGLLLAATLFVLIGVTGSTFQDVHPGSFTSGPKDSVSKDAGPKDIVAKEIVTNVKSVVAQPGSVTGAGVPTAQVTTLGETINIYLDAKGVHHIEATSIAGAFYALGYRQANEFPIATMRNLYLANGRFSTLVGNTPYAQEADRQSALWEHEKVAKEMEQATLVNNPQLYKILDAACRGINDWRAFLRANPAEIQKLENSTTQSATLAADPFSGAPPLTKETLIHIFDKEMDVKVTDMLCLGIAFNRGAINTSLAASNSMVVGGGATTTGLPIQVGDMHLPVVANFDFRGYLVDIQSPGYRVAGVCMPGWPVIVAGRNGNVTWGVSTPCQDVVTTNIWKAKDEGAYINYDNARLRIIRRNVVYKYWDVATKTIKVLSPGDPGNFTVEYVEAEASGVVLRDYPIVGKDGDGNIYFSQHSAMTSGLDQQGKYESTGSVFEFFFELGRTNCVGPGVGGTDVLFAKNLSTLAMGRNFLLSDSNGRMQFSLLARVPKQGDLAGIPKRDNTLPWHGVMDGTKSGFRWKGFHPWTDLPQCFSSDPNSREVWIMNNASPNLLASSAGGTVTNFPSYIWDNSTVATYRQLWSATLLRDPIVRDPLKKWSPAAVEMIACDQVDIWGRSMWPLIKKVAGQMPGSDVYHFVSRMELWMSEDKAAIGHPDFFTASVYSRTTPYITLLRGFFEKDMTSAIKAIIDGAKVAPPILPNSGKSPLALGGDPQVYPQNIIDFTSTNQYWSMCVSAVEFALSSVVSKYFFDPDVDGDGIPDGIENNKLYNWVLPSPIFNSFLVGSPTQEPWSGFPSDWNDGYIRWGHVNMLVLTKMFLPPPPGTGAYPSLFDIYFQAAFGKWPPFPTAGVVEVFPVGGTLDSLFVTFNSAYEVSDFVSGFPPAAATNANLSIPGLASLPKYMGSGNRAHGYHRYDQAVHLEEAPFLKDVVTQIVSPVRKTGVFTSHSAGSGYPIYFVPHSWGSRIILSMEHRVGNAAHMRYLDATGGTEITQDMADPPGVVPPDIAGKKSFHSATAGDFTKLTWRSMDVPIESIVATQKLAFPPY